MNTVALIAIVIILAVVAFAFWMYTKQRQRAELRGRFGPEYERAVDDYGERGRAEAALAARAERVEQLHIRPLAADESARYAEEWRAVQSRFVDQPEDAIGEADRLVGEVMQRRGYPMGDFDQRAADISVDHPDTVAHYRAAHTLYLAQEQADIGTEAQRQAFVHYRALFEQLLGKEHAIEKPKEATA